MNCSSKMRLHGITGVAFYPVVGIKPSFFSMFLDIRFREGRRFWPTCICELGGIPLENKDLSLM